MAVHQTCRPRAIQTARELERLGSVLAADVLEPDAGTRPSLTLEVAIADGVVPPSVLDVLARRDAALADASPQGDHTIAVAIV